jgi:Holliday junction DNA helicase RuvB
MYTPEELLQIVRRSAGIMRITIDEKGAYEIAARSRGPPRIANRLLKRVRDFAQVRANGEITREVADRALVMLEIAALGLDSTDRRMMTSMIENFGGGPVGLDTLALPSEKKR